MASGLVAGVALCKFLLRTSEIMFLYLKLASGENKLLILTFGNSKYSRAEMENQGNRTNVVRKMLQLQRALYIEFPSAHFSNCYGVYFFYFSLVNFIFNLALPPSLSHSLRIVVFLSVLLWRH